MTKRAPGALAARYVALDAARVLAPGEVVWDARGRIVALRRPRGRVADVAVVPGLVNAHAHLQLDPLPRPARDFVAWIRAVLAQRGTTTPAGQRARARAALRDLIARGTTAIGEIDATGFAPALLAAAGVTGRCYRELTGFDVVARGAGAMVRERWRAAAAVLPRGLSPHAPYSVSPDLFRAAAARSRRLAIHCAEVPEEQQLLRTGRGPFADLLAGLGKLPAGYRPPGIGAVRWLEQLGVLRRGTLLIHCQELERGDAARIRAASAAIAVCPGTIEYFRRRPPPVERWLALGIPVALGSDSIASNTGLSMPAELARAARIWPMLSPAELLAMATSHGGRALGLPCGALARGRRADLVVVPARSNWPNTLAAFVHGELPLASVVVAGRRRGA